MRFVSLVYRANNDNIKSNNTGDDNSKADNKLVNIIIGTKIWT